MASKKSLLTPKNWCNLSILLINQQKMRNFFEKLIDQDIDPSYYVNPSRYPKYHRCFDEIFQHFNPRLDYGH